MITGESTLVTVEVVFSGRNVIPERGIRERAISTDTTAQLPRRLFIRSTVLEVPEVYEPASSFLQ